MIGLKEKLNDVMVSEGWELKENKSLVMKFEQDERIIEIKLSFKKD